MDLNTITTVLRPSTRADLQAFAQGDAFLAGGTSLFSEPQPNLRRLIDIDSLGWEPLTVRDRRFSIAATCTVATLDAFEAPADWLAAPLIGLCCRSFLASFKIWNTATVGGNLCASLPAGPMISLCAALEGICVIWTPSDEERQVKVVDFCRGPSQTDLRPGEILRCIDLPREALMRRFAFRRATLSSLGRSGVLLIGTLTASGGFTLTVTASTRRPIQLAFADVPARSELQGRLDALIPEADYYDDMHGAPDWRRHMTHEFAEEIRSELMEAGI